MAVANQYVLSGTRSSDNKNRLGYENFSQLKRDLADCWTLELKNLDATRDVEDSRKLEQYLREEYQLVVASPTCFYLKRKGTDTYGRIDYQMVDKSKTPVTEHGIAVSFEHLDVLLEPNLTNSILLTESNLPCFMKKWYTSFETAQTEEFSKLFVNEKLQARITIVNGLADANIFNLIALLLKKSLSELEINLAGVRVKINSYLNINRLPYYFHACLCRNGQQADLRLLVNPRRADLPPSKSMILGRISFFHNEIDSLLRDFSYEYYAEHLAPETLESLLVKIKSLLPTTNH